MKATIATLLPTVGLALFLALPNVSMAQDEPSTLNCEVGPTPIVASQPLDTMSAAWVAKQEQEQAAERAQCRAQARDHEIQQRAAVESQRQQEAASRAEAAVAAAQAAKQKRSAAANLPTTHRDAIREVDRCREKLDRMSCFRAQMAALGNLDLDVARHDTQQICADRAIIVISKVLQVQLSDGEVYQYEVDNMDSTLGEIIDHCPAPAASWALGMRRKLHNF